MISPGALTRIFAEAGPSVHITPGELFTFQGFSITNSVVYAWVSSVVIIILSIVLCIRFSLSISFCLNWRFTGAFIRFPWDGIRTESSSYCEKHPKIGHFLKCVSQPIYPILRPHPLPVYTAR